MSIYVASSWRNEQQPEVVKALREMGFDVYDFHHPDEGDDGFHWSDIDPEWKDWSPAAFRDGLDHIVAEKGFGKDMTALANASAVVLLQPCGRSAHLELGWACGAGKPTCVLLSKEEPELMYKMVNHMALDIDEVIEWLKGLDE